MPTMAELWTTPVALLALRILLVLSTVDYVVLGIAATNIQDPRIVEHPEDKYVAKNEPATLNCKAEGEPKPTITWYRNGQPVTTAKENPTSHRMLLPNGQLFFLSIKHSKNNKPDVGLYYCNATNPRTGRWVISRNATLDIAVLRDDFKQTPQDQKAAVGDTVTLTCRPPRGLPDPRVSWTKDNTPVAIGGRMALEGGANLVIHHAQKDDSGSYVCVASNMAGERESIPARLAVAEKPKFLKSPIDALKQENEDVEFHCKAVGDPAPTITWRKEEGSIPPGRSFILPDKSLQIRRVKVEDEGAYICRAENSVGHVEKLARLTVHSKPSFLMTPRNKVVGVGRTVTLRCQVTGNPPPAVFWNKEQSQTLMFPRQDHGRFSVLDEGTLIIQRVRKSDAGEYVCQALSVAGSALAKARLTVKDVDPRPPPIIHLGPQNQTLAVKSVAMLPCQASGDPPPAIGWFKDGANIQETNPRFTLLDSGTLQISDLRKGDTGVYTCRASSETGETTWSAALVVEVPSNPNVIFRRTPEPSTFPGPPSKPTVSNIGEDVLTLSWVPSPNQGASQVFAYMVEYFSHETGQGWTVASDNIRGKSYTVRNLRGDTSYMFLVRAINQHGTSLPSPVSEPVRTTVGSGKYVRPTMPSFDMDVVVPRLSGKVVTLNEASSMGPTDVHLSWRVEKSLRFIEGFHVKYRLMANRHQHRWPPGGGPGNQAYHTDYRTETIMGGKSSSYIIRNLQAYTWYEVKVQPFYNTHIGDDSNIREVQTKMKLPSSPPVNIQAKVTDRYFIYLTWQTPEPQHFNGPLINFVAYCKANETKFDRNITIDPSNRSKMIKDTLPAMRYTIRMAITNEKGQGPLSKPVVVGGNGPLWRSFVREPWFIATLIGTIGGTLWFALCVFSVWLYRKRKARKKGLKNGVVTVPVHKSDDPSRSDTVTNQTPLLSNHSELSTGNHSNQPLPSHPLLLAQNGSGEGSEPYITYGYPPPPDLTNMLAHKEEENLYNTPITPQMRTFYNKQSQQLPQCHPYATTTLITPNYVNSQTLQGNDSAFRPINAGYVHQGSCSSDSCGKENSDSGCTDNGQPNNDLVHDSHEPLISPVCSDAGSMSSELARRSKQSSKNPVLNIADMLPPPPEHPPPSDIGTPPDSPPPGRRDYEPGYSDGSSMHYHNPHMVMPQGSIHSLRAPVYDNTPNHRLVMSDSERGPGGTPESRTARAPSPKGGHSPVYRSLSPSAGHHVRTYAPGGSRLSDSEGPVRAYKLVPLNEQELASHYSDTERGATPPVRIIHLTEGAPPVMDDPTMDRGCQSSLPSLVGDNHREPMTNGVHQEGEYAETGAVEGDHRPDCLTPESSVGEGDSVTGSMLASWASVTDQSNSSCCSSNRSSAVSSSDGSFFAEADFASAVAKAAELSGLTVVGSTVTDPQSGAKKKKNYRHRPAKRPTSPYSTDSNFSAAPHKPYPKASRKKQLQQQANKYSPNQPAFKPRPQTRAKPNLSSLKKEHSLNGEVPSYARPSYPATSPTSNGTVGTGRSSVSRQSDRTPTNLTSGGDSDSTLRSNPLALLDSAQDTPIV